MFGERCSPDELNMEWPDKLTQITAEISLRSIEFKSYANGDSRISSVRCTLTNGVSSPLFEKEDVVHYHPVTYNFDPNKKVSKL